MDCSTFTDFQLIDLLYTEGDRLPRSAVDEFVRRGERMVPLLSEVVSDQFKWTRRLPEWWAVVHATFILGAIGSESAVIPLLRALRWADAFDCDWVTEAMPAIFGRIGPVATLPLKVMAADPTNGCFTRSIVMDGLGLIAWHHPRTKQDTGTFIYSIFADEKSDLEIKQFSGNTLLDLGCVEYREVLLAFGREERARKDQDLFYSAHFFDDDVEEALKNGGKDMAIHDRDWLSFYNEEEIKERQKRWQKETEEQEDTATLQEDERFIASGIEPYVRQVYIGRNDPCPCGSGRKYKKCCLGKET